MDIKKTLIIALSIFGSVLLLIVIAGVYKFNFTDSDIYYEGPKMADIKNATYKIEGREVALVGGISEVEIAPGSTSKVVTKYFGNNAQGELNGDNQEDEVFIMTQNSGGSGTFYYVAVLLSSPPEYKTFVGSNAILLGDRISPQATEIRDGEIIINYADRLPDEPMSAQPSVGVSKYFKIINGELVEKEVLSMGEDEAKIIAEKTCIKGDEALEAGFYNENSKTWWFNANLNSTKPGCSPACVVNEETKMAEINWRCTGLEPEPVPGTKFCKTGSRADVCAEIYMPVCATVNIQCIKAPCNPVQQTFGNACEACRNPLVKYYVEGECVKR